mmetsp:Transcript_43920/g.131661  ORF Transcript_43920/g.131661 Transcript_43920/m.131661 type:complete len:319 (-) Transcript_43920:1081-2037(-)
MAELGTPRAAGDGVLLLQQRHQQQAHIARTCLVLPRLEHVEHIAQVAADQVFSREAKHRSARRLRALDRAVKLHAQLHAPLVQVLAAVRLGHDGYVLCAGRLLSLRHLERDRHKRLAGADQVHDGALAAARLRPVWRRVHQIGGVHAGDWVWQELRQVELHEGFECVAQRERQVDRGKLDAALFVDDEQVVVAGFVGNDVHDEEARLLGSAGEHVHVAGDGVDVLVEHVHIDCDRLARKVLLSRRHRALQHRVDHRRVLDHVANVDAHHLVGRDARQRGEHGAAAEHRAVGRDPRLDLALGDWDVTHEAEEHGVGALA